MPLSSTDPLVDDAGSPEQPSRLKSIRFGLALAMISTILTLGLLEIGVRVALPAHHPEGHNRWVLGKGERPRLGEAGKTVTFRHKAGDYDTTATYSAEGLRESRPLSESTTDDLFVVGDSFAFGYGVDEDARFSNRLEEPLGRRVYNISIPEDVEGYGKLVRYAERHGATIHELIIAFCMENDLWDYSNPRGQRVIRTGITRLAFLVKVWMNGHSALYRYVTTLLNQAPKLRRIAVGVGIAGDYDKSVSGEPLPEQVISSSVAALKKLADSRASTILIIPSRGLWAGHRQEVASQSHDATVAAMMAAGLDIVDLRPHFEAGGEPLSYHFEHDGHWNPKGHQLAADVLAEHLRAGSAGP